MLKKQQFIIINENIKLGVFDCICFFCSLKGVNYKSKCNIYQQCSKRQFSFIIIDCQEKNPSEYPAVTFIVHHFIFTLHVYMCCVSRPAENSHREIPLPRLPACHPLIVLLLSPSLACVTPACASSGAGPGGRTWRSCGHSLRT